ncbi:MAG: hypothetical protein OXL97_12075 [Chloroflexota bacterium]|nr:hypothetical protein [Chloroflexota bacterium]MDE2884598.1 hypothetical protein [Chloroflexota bacterium]
MTDRIFVLGPLSAKPYNFPDANWICTTGQAEDAIAKTDKPARRWMLGEPTATLFASTPARSTSLHLVALEPVAPHRLPLLHHLFKSVIAGAELLELSELLDVVDSNRRRDLFIGGVVDLDDEVLLLYRGDFTSVLVPLAWFEPRPTVGSPDWGRFQITDFGQTLRMGEYEAAADAILYDFDPVFRREAKKRLLEKDDSFGGALRRLRLQRELRRSDFPPLTAKEVARIERGEVQKPRINTLLTLANRLGVEPEQIAEY